MAGSAYEPPALGNSRISPGNDFSGKSDDSERIPTLTPGVPEDEDMHDDDDMHSLFGSEPSSPKADEPNHKKKPRSLCELNKDDADTPEPSPTKKARTSIFGEPSKNPADALDSSSTKKVPVSLFGGPIREAGVAGPTPPQTPGTGLGGRMSTLALEPERPQETPEERGGSALSSLASRSGDNALQSTSPDLSQEPRIKYTLGQDTDGYGESTIQEDSLKAFGLRQNINRQAISTHIDIDQSGDYDPAEEQRNMIKARTAKLLKNKKAKKGKGKTEVERKEKRIVRLKFRAIGSVLNVTDQQDNWPDGHSIVESEDEAEREELLSFFRKDSPKLVENLHVPDPAGQYEDLTGHPALRGCKKCRLEGKQCSTVTDGEFPCHDCVKSKADCDPCMQQGGFKPCKRCVEHCLPCSFEHLSGDDDIAMCDECIEEDNTECEAVPTTKVGYTHKRIDLQHDYFGPQRKWLACTHCREEGKKCSLKKNTDKAPCNRCKKNKLGCHFYDAVVREREKPAKNKGKGKNKKKEDEEEPAAKEKPSPTKRTLPDCDPEYEVFSAEDLEYMEIESSPGESAGQHDSAELTELLEDAEGHIGFSTKFKTCFAHPMVFSVKPFGHPESVRDCNFCQMPMFCFTGYYEREVHAIQWSNGMGYTEFGNGHREQEDATTMCKDCTFDRIQIMVCENHGIQPMDVDDSQLDHDAAADDLMSTQAGPPLRSEMSRWCSLCFNTATHQCCTPQPCLDGDENAEEPVLRDGCGLRLCDRCTQELKYVFDNNLLNMVVAFDKQPKMTCEDSDDDEDVEREMVGAVRADVGFLSVNGLLMSCVNGSMEG